MATTTYSWSSAQGLQLNTGSIIGNQNTPTIAASADGNAYFSAWTHPADPGNPFSSDSVHGAVVGSDTGSVAQDFLVNSTTANDQLDASLAALNDGSGRYVAVFTDYSGGGQPVVRLRLFEANGTPVGDDFVNANSILDTQGDVAALANGTFVVTGTVLVNVADTDIRFALYEADGTAIFTGSNVVNIATDLSSDSSVAALAPSSTLPSGGFVAAWQSNTGGDNAVYFRRYSVDGQALDGSSMQGVLIDAFGDNTNIQVAGLPDGGFVVAYTDDGWINGDGTDITARVFNADGSARSSFKLVNDGYTAGNQNNPSLTVLSNGYFAIGWTEDSGQQRTAAFDPNGNRLTLPGALGGVKDVEIAGLAGGKVALTWQSTFPDASGDDSIYSTIYQLTRTVTGGSSDETIAGIDDGLPQHLVGLGGNDTLIAGAGGDLLQGGLGFDYASYSTAPSGVLASLAEPGLNTGYAAGDQYSLIEGLIGSAFDDTLTGNSGNNILIGGDGNDTLVGGAGDDTIDGAAGDDTAVFSGNLANYTVQDFGAKIAVSGPDGNDTLLSIGHLQFADATLQVVDDGNPLFDQLYYYSRNTDVYFAGVNALDHYNAFGWHEGRDPSYYFDTSGYLAVSKDVAAAGVNPLEHYHQSGWHEGRDPSARFDTTLYLIHNPDVAAAGVDPLAHYLQYGHSEGRAAYDAIGSNIGNGFDAQYYLFKNPDVAAAGVDPLQHYNTFGWHEGRNPNAFFDSAGYLSHYADIAAAGVNPFDHYNQFGWTEGRDPSAAFDTQGYLAANPDVAAAGVNPLQHYLQFGIYEGRQLGSDGVWG